MLRRTVRAERCDNGRGFPRASAVMAQSPIVVLIVIAALGLIVYNLGAGLYYMLTDKGETKRTVNALTRRVALSVGLILLIILGIATGVITPHDVGR
jgi:succinate dehydrogenase/fumarate reductase cytochrome b subunit